MTVTRRGIRGLVAVVFCVLAQQGSALGAVNHPFGSHPFAYTAGTIQPNHVTQPAQDQAVRDFYDAWKAEYVKEACGTGRYVVASNTQPGNLTVSEAMGYGMMIMALMAGHDPDTKRIFDGMYAHFRAHPSIFFDDLMAWNQNKSCADVEGGDSASDGDLDIAFALLLADKQWGSCGTIDYGAAALEVLADIKAGELNPGGDYVLLGDWATPSVPTYHNSTRSSDFMPDHLRAYAAVTADTVWTDVLDTTYGIVDNIQDNHSPTTGLLPDFIVNPLGSPAPAAPGFLEGDNDGAYDYNACRDPWRISTDYLVSGDARAKTAVEKITTFFRGATGNNPDNIESGYQLNGTLSPGADYRSMAFVAPLGVGAMVDSANQAWLNDIWDLVNATSLSSEGYYENTLKLLSLIVMSGNWWTPPGVSGGCVPDSTPLCTDGGYISALSIKVGGVLAGPDRQSLNVKGKIFFPLGIPVPAPYNDGAQILIEDLGNGSSAIYELSRFTTSIPPASAGTCDAGRDGWSVTPSRTLYKNGSTALNPPVCTAGTSAGLTRLKYKPRTTSDLDFQAIAKRTTIANPVGPLQATLVLGATQTASDNGACGLSSAIPCEGTGNTRRCR